MEQTLGKRIVANRKRIGLTQDQLAEQLGVTAQAVSKWENDQSCPDIATLPKLAEIFRISTDELLGREASRPAFDGEVVDADRKSEGLHVQKGNWEFRWDNGRADALTFALWVLSVGVLTLLSRIYAWDASFWSILWPSGLLIYGIKGAFSKFTFFSLGCALFGGYFLGSNLHIWKLDIGGEIIFPAILVLFGISLLVDATRKPKKAKVFINHRGDSSQKTKSSFREDGESFDCNLSFGENVRRITLPRLSYGCANVSFGELAVDLTGCEEIAEGCRIDAKCSFGQLVLFVPKTCRAITDTGTAFGAVEIEGHANPDAADEIHICGQASFGEIKVKYI